jgi:kynureninase
VIKVIYFNGNSFGSSKRTRAYVDEVMDWANLAVEGHFMLKSLGGIIERLAKPLGKIMGHCHLKLL